MGAGGARAQGFLDNTAQAVGSTNGVSVRSEDSARVELAPARRALRITCTATLDDRDGVPGMSAGDLVIGAIEIGNGGDAALRDVLVSGPAGRLLSPEGGDDGDRRLGTDETWRYLASAPVRQEDIDTNGGGTGLLGFAGAARATGVGPVPFACELPVDARPALGLLKTADPTALAASPPRIDYTLRVVNTGNVTLRGVVVRDERLVPPEHACPPIRVGEACVRVRSYRPSAADLDGGSIENRATATHTAIGGGTISSTGTVVVELYPPGSIRLGKGAAPSRARRGESVTFTLTLANDAPLARGGLRLVDDLPPGLAFVEGTVRVNGLRVPARASGRRVEFGPLRVEANGDLALTFRATVTAEAVPGALVNRAEAVDTRTGRTVARARARVEVVAEPVLDTADVIGRVFEDRNRNGVQDAGEPGIPRVRVATVRGLVVTADEEGRFSVPAAAIPRAAIGGNFILKLDEASLPRGTTLTTENPRVVRLTAGKVTRVSFGVAPLRDVEVQLDGRAFVPGGTALDRAWAARLDELVDVLRRERAVLRLVYRAAPGERELGDERALGDERLRALEAALRSRWARRGEAYPLEVERRVVVDRR